MTKSRPAEQVARRAYQRLSLRGRGLGKPKPRLQANTLDSYMRPASELPIEPVLQAMQTMFASQRGGSSTAASIGSPPVSSLPKFDVANNFKGAHKCPNKHCKSKGNVFKKAKQKISTQTALGRWLCDKTGQLPIGEPWCCNSCYQTNCREWRKLTPEQQAPWVAAAAPQLQPSPAPTPSTSRAPPKAAPRLFANLKAGGAQERAIKKFAWQA